MRIELRNQAIGTSGSYFKGNHIVDPVTREAVTHPLLSASVIAPTSTTADALATALYVMGLEKGMDWARLHQIHAIFILEDGRIFEVDAP
ncbi:MAG: FAD:protein FMN transferase [Luteolibacter sp.]